MTPYDTPIRRLRVLVAGCANPPPGTARIALALICGALTHLAFVTGVGAMMVAMFFGLSKTFGTVAWPWSLVTNAALIVQFPLLHSALLSGMGRRMLNRMIPGAHGRTLATTTYALIASLQLLALFTLWTPSGMVWWQAQGGLFALLCLWVAAHGVMIVTPVNWYQVSSPIKLMMDRLVCADGGNPDPTLTDGKDAALAKQIELDGWSYPRHLSGRSFSVIVHGDVSGAADVRRSVSDWLRFMKLTPAGAASEVDRYIGYWEPYATSHQAFDDDKAMQDEVRNAARSLAEAVAQKWFGACAEPGETLTEPRRK